MFRYKVEMFFIKLTVKILMTFSEKSRYNFAEKLALFVYKKVNSRRELALKNIKLAFPKLNEKEIKRIAIESYKNMIKAFIMPFWIKDVIETPDKIKYDNVEILDEVYKRGKGVILIGLHMGCIDACTKLTEKFSVYDVVRRQKNPYLDKYMNDIRRSLGLNVIYKGKHSAKALIKAIRSNGVVGLFSDHYDSSGFFTEFFGKKTKISTGGINLALRYGTPIVFVYNTINQDNTSTIHFMESFEIEKTGDTKKDIEINTKKMVKIFEKIITEYPEQWMWFHKRWRD